MTPGTTAARFVSRKRWSVTRPRTLVIACSDGRLQESLDDFLENHLGVTHYDRLYAPGGPGALAASGFEFLRADQFRRECAFLLEAHGTEEVVLVFHGAAADGGPDEAICADYKRKLPRQTGEAIAGQQEADVAEILRSAFGWKNEARIHIFRAEVTADQQVRFVDLAGS